MPASESARLISAARAGHDVDSEPARLFTGVDAVKRPIGCQATQYLGRLGHLIRLDAHAHPAGILEQLAKVTFADDVDRGR